MTYKGVAKGKTIELDQPLPYPDGQPVTVSVERADRGGSSAQILEAVRAGPHVAHEDVDELERAIEDAKLPVRDDSILGSGQ